eukprot:14136331-Ditylum_brightwellii.AAC.1
MDKDIKLIPAPVDVWLYEGPVIQWFKNGHNKKQHPFHKYCFGNCAGSVDGIAMCSFSIESTHFCGILKTANTTWVYLYDNYPYGITYNKRTPKDWATQFFAAKMTWHFTQYIICCITEETSDLTGSDVPTYLNKNARFPRGQYQQR